MMQLHIRQYQKDGIASIQQAWQLHRSALFQMPTGTGKTTLFCEIVRSFIHEIHPNKKVLIVTHRKELVEQVFNRLVEGFHLTAGIIAASYSSNWSAPVQVASIQTLVRRSFYQQDEYSLVVIDEAHHALASMYRKLWQYFPSAKFLGVTATPVRTNGEGFADLFNTLVSSASIKWFIKAGFLADTRYYASHMPDISNVPIKAGDYNENELAEVMQHQTVMADLVQSYRDFAAGKKMIVFAVNRQHSANIVARYNKEGIIAKAIDTNTSKEERHAIVQDFRINRFQVLCNVNIFTEGFDCPDVEVVQLARPTKSLTLFLQQVGRCMRPHQSKSHGLILDNAGLWKEHGLPKMDRQWSLYGKGNSITLGTDGIVGFKEMVYGHHNEPFESKSLRLEELDDVTDVQNLSAIPIGQIEKHLTDKKILTMRDRVEDLLEKIEKLQQRVNEEADPEFKEMYQGKIMALQTELDSLQHRLQPKRLEQMLELMVKTCYDLLDNNEILIDGDKEYFLSKFSEPGFKADAIQQTKSVRQSDKTKETITQVDITTAKPSPGQVEIFHYFPKFKKKVSAIFNPADGSIIYNNQSFKSPSAAAIQATSDVTGHRSSLNGWIFWVFLDEHGRERAISDLRK